MQRRASPAVARGMLAVVVACNLFAFIADAPWHKGDYIRMIGTPLLILWLTFLCERYIRRSKR